MTAPSPSYSWNVDPFASSSVWATVPSPPLASTSSSSPPPTKPAAPEEDTWDADSNHDASPAFEDRARATEDAFEVEEEDDFAEPMGEGDDDFGDFDDGEAFPEAAEEPAQPEATAIPVIRPGMTMEELAPALAALFDRIFPLARQALSDEPERQVGGTAQTLVNEQTRHLFAQLCEPPAMRPVDWKRSRTRREHLIALGVPVNLDELAAPDARLLPPLVTSVPRRASPSSAPTQSTGATSRPASRQSVTVARPMARTPPPPPIDRAKAKELLALSEEQLSLLPLARLEAVKKEMQGLASGASQGLTRALEKREALATAGEVYDAKIQELVVAAQRLKPSPATSNDLKRSSSNKSSMWRPNRSASPASGGSGRAIR